MIVANDVTAEGAGFDVDTNIVTLFSRDGRDLPLPRMSKAEVAQRILDEALRLRGVLRSKPASHRRGRLSAIMAERIPESLQKKIEERLRYHEDLGIDLFYREREVQGSPSRRVPPSADPLLATAPVIEENSLPKNAPKQKPEPESSCSSQLSDILPPAFRAFSVRIRG